MNIKFKLAVICVVPPPVLELEMGHYDTTDMTRISIQREEVYMNMNHDDDDEEEEEERTTNIVIGYTWSPIL